MKKQITSMICMINIIQTISGTSNILTFRHNSGRLGDVILNYLKHYYIAESYGLALHTITSVPYLDQFAAGDITKSLMHSQLKKGKKTKINHVQQIDPNEENRIYVSDYELIMDFDTSNYGETDTDFYKDYYPDMCADFLFDQTIEQPHFGKNIKKLLTPKKSYTFDIPGDITTVAIHIRKPSNTDFPLSSRQYIDAPSNPYYKNIKNTSRFHDRNYPFKFPPEQYYLDQLLFLHNALDKRPLYVFIFSDSKGIHKLVERLKRRIKHIPNIKMAFKNQSKDDVLEDAIHMSNFDYLIRSRSYYSWISQMIGDHKGIIIPTQGKWENDYLNITESILLIPDRKNRIIQKVTIDSKNIEYIQEKLL